MRLRSVFLAASLTGLSLFGACSGNGGSTAVASPACGGSSTFCLIGCNLGCRLSGDCAITEIAQNQVLQLDFSQTVDPNSVNGSTLALSTASGEAPAGEFLVSGSSIIFQPSASTVGGSTIFGFRPNETYILSIAGNGAADTIRSDSGDPMSVPVFCQLNVSRGLIDLDQRAPSAELLTAADVPLPRMGEIELRFSELLDPSAFVGITPGSSPITYQIRATIPDPMDPSQLICAESGATGLISAIPTLSVDTSGDVPRSVVSLTPNEPLPGESCVRVTISSRVRDIAGTQAESQEFDLIVEAGDPEPFTVTEAFGITSNLEADQTGATLSMGRLIPADIGGAGEMGIFNPMNGNQVGPNEFQFDTTNTTIPAEQTLMGQPILVDDGVFNFSTFVVPDGTTVRFVGDVPAVINVAGTVDIQGTVSVEGFDPVQFQGRTFGLLPISGQPGALGGAGGGAGGKGGDSGDAMTDDDAFDGLPGEPAETYGTSGYSGLLGMTGGDGGELFPPNGMPVQVPSFYQGIPSTAIAASGGGGGGGFIQAGGIGRRIPPIQVPFRPQDQGADTAGGAAVGFQPPMGLRSIEHFLVGGSGGGGGGSSIFGTEATRVNDLNAGAGGAGGGGAIAIRAGGPIRLSTSLSRITAAGGSAPDLIIAPLNPAERTAMPGGAGSGGSIILQSGQSFSSSGSLDIGGGDGGSVQTRLFFPTDNSTITTVEGGDGSPGQVRLELPLDPSDPIEVADLGQVFGIDPVPAGSVGTLDPNDRDPMTTVMSKFRPSGRIIPPNFTHYRLTCVINGMTVVYTDESPVDPGSFANFANGPVQVMFQGATVSPGTDVGIDPGPFRSFINPEAGVSINSDVPTGFRFLLMFDRSGGDSIEVEELVVFGQG